MPITHTPLRYPGGKSKLYNYTVKLLEHNNIYDCIYVEPFAGGAGLALSLLIKGNVKSIVINDSDYSIFAFWFCALNKTDELVDYIDRISITIDEWLKQREIQREPHKYDLIDVAISTLFLNRTNRSGIIKGGVIGGINQNGKYKLNSRFNKKDIIRKIKLIAALRNKIQLYNLDIFDFIPNVINNLPDNAFIYFDPPYIVQGSNLYCNYFTEKDHKDLSKLIKNISVPWFLTYDNQCIVHKMYEGFKIKEIDINYSAGRKRMGKELMVFSNNIVPF
ncbi:MAG: adenine methylase [Thermoanaerobacteraceae bacterium]|nr:adenine methylase [Thermoanaerobacteraceae bacterium]